MISKPAAPPADEPAQPASPGAYGVRPPAFRLPEATRVGRVRLQVADLDRSVAFYEQVLGLRVAARDAAGARLTARHDDAVLVELDERRGATPVPRRGRLGLYHFAILLPDRLALGRFVAHLGALGVYAGASDHFVSEALYLTDPDGLGIEVYADRPRDRWLRRGRELHMTSAPLDLPALARAAGGQPWDGLPAGTTVGHVHLHVSDLDAAARFYHETLGFDAVVWSYPGALFFSAGGYHHHLGTNIWAAGAVAPGPNDARLVLWDLVLPGRADVDAAAASLAGGGYTVTPLGEAVSVDDPDGTTLRLTAEPRAE